MLDGDDISFPNQDGNLDDIPFGDDALDAILNALMDESNQLNVKTEGQGNFSSSTSSRKGSISQAQTSANNKKRKYNPDAEKIAEVTEAALRSLDIDPSSQDAKKKRRQIRNRLSAQFHRDRKNAYIKELEEANEAHKQLIGTLEKRIQELEKENIFLKNELGYFHPTIRSGSTGSTTAASDTEMSSSGSSPIHDPDYHHTGLNSIREITPNRYPTSAALPLPVAKTLGLLSVLCILCMTYLEHPLKTGGAEHSGFVESNPRRRLDALPQSVLDEMFLLPSANDSSFPSVIPNQYLRGSTFDATSNNSNLSNAPVVFTSNALIPFELPYQYQNDWYPHKEQFDSLSFSHIMMNSGVALFDPSMKFRRDYAQTHLPQHQLEDPKLGMAIVPTITHNPFDDHFHHSPRIYRQINYDKTGRDVPVLMDINESKEDENGSVMEQKHWPAVTSPHVPQYMSDHVTRAIEAPLAMDCSHCVQDETIMLAKLLEKANLVTVTVPASLVRMGKSVQDSEHGTVEGIMEMFNLTSENGDKNHSKTVFPNSLNEASVEINCVILSAKLIMNAQQKH